MAPAAKERANGSSEWDNWTKKTPSKPAKTSTNPLSCPYLDKNSIRFSDTDMSAYQNALNGPMPKERNGRLIANPKKCIDIDRVGPFLSLSVRRLGCVSHSIFQKERPDCTNISQSSRCDGIWIRIAFLFSDSPMHQIDKPRNGVIFNLDLLIVWFDHGEGLFAAQRQVKRRTFVASERSSKGHELNNGSRGKRSRTKKTSFCFFLSIDVRRNNWGPFISLSSN